MHNSRGRVGLPEVLRKSPCKVRQLRPANIDTSDAFPFSNNPAIEEGVTTSEGDALEEENQSVPVYSLDMCAALYEVNLLKAQVQEAAESARKANAELQILKEKFSDAVILIENTKLQFDNSKNAQYMANDALCLLETAKRSMETVMEEEMKAKESYQSIVAAICESNIRVAQLDKRVSDLERSLNSRDSIPLEEYEKAESNRRETKIAEMESELRTMQELNDDLKNIVLRKDFEIETLKNQVAEAENEGNKVKKEAEEGRSRERDALREVETVMEEWRKSERKVVRVTEQVAIAQAAGEEMETQLRMLKVQSDQWRKAAEAAASLLTTDSRKGSPIGAHFSVIDDVDDAKSRNGRLLKSIGVLWKKPNKWN